VSGLVAVNITQAMLVLGGEEMNTCLENAKKNQEDEQ
jgi:hypothetical protein